METAVWLFIMIPASALITGIGIYAWKRRKPMWFWSGSTVSESEISDIPAYNRANGIMWISFSAVFWISTALGLFHQEAAGIVLEAGCLAGVPALIFTYQKIYKKYRVPKDGDSRTGTGKPGR